MSALIEDARAVPAGQLVIYVLRDETGQALYVGQTDNLRRRLLQHRRSSDWWLRVATVEHNPVAGGRNAAHATEAGLIGRELPLFNRTFEGLGARTQRYSA